MENNDGQDTPNDNLKFILDAFHESIKSKFESRFPAIKFNCEEQLGSVVGFISAYRYIRKIHYANELANNFISGLTFLNNHENKKVTTPSLSREINMPNRMCELRSDRTNLGFSFCIYVHVDNPNPVMSMKNFGVWNIPYAFSYNGGFLFHGLQNVMSITLDNKLGWQIHT